MTNILVQLFVYIFLVWYQNMKISCLGWFLVKKRFSYIRQGRYSYGIWSLQNPKASVELQRNCQKVNLFCALSEQKVYRPFFAEITITSAACLDFLGNWLWPQLTNDIPQNLFHFRQYRAPPHYHRVLRQFLNDQLPGERDQSLGLRRYYSPTTRLLLLRACQRTRLHSTTAKYS